MKNSTKYSYQDFVTSLRQIRSWALVIMASFMVSYLIWFFCYVVYVLVKRPEQKNKGEFADYMRVPQSDMNASVFTTEKFKQALKDCGIRFPEIVYAQARLETGNFKSQVFIKYNNAFGFRTNDNYLRFDSWMACIEYKKRWQKRKFKGGDYYAFLDTSYAEDSLYVEKLKRIVRDERHTRQKKACNNGC